MMVNGFFYIGEEWKCMVFDFGCICLYIFIFCFFGIGFFFYICLCDLSGDDFILFRFRNGYIS